MKPVYSFDVFDTCLCRLCGEPRLLFDVLSLKMQQATDKHLSEHMRQLFVATRATADGNSLTEIYKKVAEQYPLPISVEKMVQLELDTERQLLVPIQETLQQVNRLREKGDILFISDMYLPSDFIRERLIEHGFFREGDRLYVSDELQAWKHNGTLYHLIHEKEGIPFRQWHHYGDNRKSDYTIPRRLGIHAHHLHYDYLPYEEQWRQIPVLNYQFPTILSGIARAVRLSSNAPDDQKAFVCNVTAPLMVSWVLQIMNDAQQRGIRRLYFCARDMHTEYHVARNLQYLFPSIGVFYLFISRQSMESDENLLCEYFKQVGLLSSEKTAIIDSNSSGKSLIKINSLVGRQTGFTPIWGYYIMGWNSDNNLTPTTQDLNNLNYCFSPAYMNSISTPSVRRLLGMRILYELILSLNYHKRTVGYEYHGNKIRPILASDTEDTWSMGNTDLRQAKKENDNLTITFSNAIVVTGLHLYAKDVFSQIAIPTLAEFTDRPRKDYLKYLTHFIWQGEPFVGTADGRYVWKRGSRFYFLPQIITTPLRAILANHKLRANLNRLLSCLNHN